MTTTRIAEPAVSALAIFTAALVALPVLAIVVIAAQPVPEPVAPVVAPIVAPPKPVAATTTNAAPQPTAAIDWQRFAPTAVAAAVATVSAKPAVAALSTVRVRAPLLDRLVNHAGEVMIARSRIESEVGTMKGSLGDLTENLERLRSHLRDIELQAETQISSRMEAAKAVGANFDPLEMDRFTRFQELTRMMAESVNDVATVQRSLTRTLQLAEDDLAAQARLTRDMQDDLLRTRMVEFEGISERLREIFSAHENVTEKRCSAATCRSATATSSSTARPVAAPRWPR